jgi:hypothetical protein
VPLPAHADPLPVYPVPFAGAKRNILEDRLFKQLMLRVLEQQSDPLAYFTDIRIDRRIHPKNTDDSGAGRISPFRCWIRVDFPEPLCPTMPSNSPGWTEKEMSCRDSVA